MKLIEFIKEHENWRELLSSDPYNLIIKDYHGEEDGLQNLVVFSYPINADFNYEICKEARGVILDKFDWSVVQRGFDKFFNYGEKYADELDWNSSKVMEKVDGSIIKCSYYKDKWLISTNNSINAFETHLHYDDTLLESASKAKTFGELFVSCFDMQLLNNYSKNYTYIFELVGPENRIVVPYSKVEVIFLGSRHRLTGEEELPMEDFFPNIRIPKFYGMSSLEDVLLTAKELPFSEEGYVVVDKGFNRLKVKSPSYVAAHHLANNGMLSVKNVIEMIQTGESEEYLTYFPENKKAFETVEGALKKLNHQLHLLVDDYEKRKDSFETRKDLAMHYQHEQYKSLIFKMASNPSYTIENYLEGMTQKNLVETLENIIGE
jgi:hypothetical protein